MEQDSNLQGAAKAQPFSKRPPRTDGASPSEGKCKMQNDECRMEGGMPPSAISIPNLHSAFCLHHSCNSPTTASYGTRTRSNTVTGCRADPHTYEATQCPRQELNLDLELRTLAWSPFHHGDGIKGRRQKDEGRRKQCCLSLYRALLFILLPSAFPHCPRQE